MGESSSSSIRDISISSFMNIYKQAFKIDDIFGKSELLF